MRDKEDLPRTSRLLYTAQVCRSKLLSLYERGADLRSACDFCAVKRGARLVLPLYIHLAKESGGRWLLFFVALESETDGKVLFIPREITFAIAPLFMSGKFGEHWRKVCKHRSSWRFFSADALIVGDSFMSICKVIFK